MKEYQFNFKKHQFTLSKEEGEILQIAIEVYKELFPKILEIKNPKFMQILEHHLKITLIPKNMILQKNSLPKADFSEVCLLVFTK